KAGETFPTFLALNSENADGPGFLAAKYAAFKTPASRGGLPNITHPAGKTRFEQRLSMLRSLDGPLGPADDYRDFYAAAQGLTYDPAVDRAFSFVDADSVRYGSSNLGDACLTAFQALAADRGTRFVQITSNDGWDMHLNIYSGGPLGIASRVAMLDLALSA